MTIYSGGFEIPESINLVPAGGGTSGSVDVINGSGLVVGVLQQGSVGVPFDPRGLYFTSDGQLLIADTDPAILSAPSSAFTAIPESGTWAPPTLGFLAFLITRRRLQNGK